MSTTPAQSATHEIFNQSRPLEDYNAYASDRALRAAVTHEGASAFEHDLHQYGAIAGSEILALGGPANVYKPVLHTHDRYGRRIDQVEFHPSYHRLMELGIGHGLTSLSWSGKPGARVARSALMFLHNQFEAGTMCPITMSHASIPALRQQPEIAAQWEPRVLSGQYDPAFRPAAEKRGATIGMAMTEKQGGSDVRTNTTRARALGSSGGGQAYELVGHKWFCSAPMADAFLSLAQTPEGLGCFLVPRFRPDDSVNPVHILRLKDKLGNCSNASSEIEYPGTWAQMVGEPGRGVATIIRMVAETRLDCALGSAALMRQATAQALHHCIQREAFGQPLARQPLMMAVLADLALEAEAALRLGLHLARRFEQAAAGDQDAERIARIATPIAKYWVCKRAVGLINEAQECLGGAGYVEEFILPRLYREAPVNAIWEGSGNIQCLDVLRVVQREPDCLEALISYISPALSSSPMLRTALDQAKKSLADPAQAQAQARQLVETLALGLQAAILLESGPAFVAESFIRARLHRANTLLYGGLPPGIDTSALIERALPQVEAA